MRKFDFCTFLFGGISVLFNSYEFIFLFLPATVFVYYFFNRIKKYTLAKASLILASLFFYGYNNVFYIGVMLSSILVNYLCYLLIQRHQKRKKMIVAAGVIFNLALLGYFKYFDFLLLNLNMLAGTQFDYLDIALPLGISFFTFQQISFLLDSGAGTCRCADFIDYMLFVTFFPQLVAGPIVTHDEIIPQLESKENKTIDASNLMKGVQAFSIGLCKKVLIADFFGKIVAFGYQNIPNLNTLEASLTILAYTIQIYFDFSGYCDMATGIALLFNVQLPANFNAPYKATNIIDFWKRWHITLTRFLTRYVYIPLGGNRKGTTRTYINILLVFLISGFWHGAGYTFLLWGLLHGIANVFTRVFMDAINKVPRWICWCFNFAFLNITWTIFRAESMAQAVELICRVFSGGFMISDDLQYQLRQMMIVDIFSQDVPFRFVLTGFSAAAVLGTLCCRNTNEIINRQSKSIWMLAGCCILFVLSVMSLAGVSTFLYFNF